MGERLPALPYMAQFLHVWPVSTDFWALLGQG